MTKDEAWEQYLNGVVKTDMKQSLFDMLQQVAKEQREIIAKKLPDRCFVDIDESWITSMDSPLNEETL